MSITDKIDDAGKIPFPPLVPLENATKYLRNVVAQGGTSGTYDDLSRAFGTSGIKSGTFFARLYALKNFGFIEIDKNKTYRLTSLGLDLIHPDSENGEILAIQTAFKNIDTLRVIWEGYRSQILPAREYFPNALGKKFGIPDDRKEKWAEYFFRSAQFARLVEERPVGLYVIGGLAPGERRSKVSEPSIAPKPISNIEDISEAIEEPMRHVATRPVGPSRTPQNTSEAIEELSNIMTSGNKLHRRIGNSYILLYMDSSMTQDEAIEFQKVLDKLSEAAKTLLSMI